MLNFGPRMHQNRRHLDFERHVSISGLFFPHARASQALSIVRCRIPRKPSIGLAFVREESDRPNQIEVRLEYSIDFNTVTREVQRNTNARQINNVIINIIDNMIGFGCRALANLLFESVGTLGAVSHDGPDTSLLKSRFAL